MKIILENSFSYYGFLTPEKIEDLIVEIRSYLEKYVAKSRVRRRIYIVIVEALENIQKHTSTDLVENNKIHFSLVIEENEYILEFSNVIFCTDSVRIKDLFLKIQNKSKSEIKELYKTTITKSEISDKGGAGLGLLEIAKVSDNNIDYRFKCINKNICEFVLEVRFDI